MKRFNVHVNFFKEAYFEEAPEGEWVRYEDANAANARIALLERTADDCATELEAANARAEAAERDLQRARDRASEIGGEVEIAESESAALRAEVERHKRGRAENGEAYDDCASRLAAANALLERHMSYTVEDRDDLLEETRAHLAAQPATAGEDDEADDAESLLEQLDEALCTLLHDGGEVGEHSPRTHLALHYARRPATAPTRTEADQRVLDAMAKADIYQGAGGEAVFAIPSEEGNACRAELARRGLK